MKTEKELIEFIAKTPSASFVDLKRFFGADFDGEYEMALPEPYQNMVLWTGMKLEVIKLIGEAIRNNKINPVPTTTLIYLMDGQSLRLPIAKKAFKYKTPHWIPIVFHVVKDKSNPKAVKL
jgi:hypothetical protein